MVSYTPVAVDRLAMILSPEIYPKWVEGKHPHTPREVAKFVSSLKPKEKEAISVSIKNTNNILKIWGDALNQAEQIK